MMSSISNISDEEYSVIGDNGEIGFINYEEDESVCNYNPDEEGPIIISIPFPFLGGKPRWVFLGETSVESITIKNTIDDPVELWKVCIYASNPENSFTLSVMEPPKEKTDLEYKQAFIESFCLQDRILQPHKTLTVWLSCKPKEIGLHTTAVHFDVGADRIERVVFLVADDKISRFLASKKPYSKVSKKKQNVVDEFIVGSRPSKVKTRLFKYKLPPYNIPTKFREELEGEQVPEAIQEGLTKRNYASYFRTLLIMEELQMEEEMSHYEMKYATMRRKGIRYLKL